ncbi:hypothetical protein [Flavobacterium sp. HSC-61S13]|uniref:hypothetical protein n=1 Tax=Flavobacterium sp. HSC-61S13 TaxID=2910963 RepID=UPI00209D5E80|nr:hypothetical protein [Flavobacterium sp. HSC-61S13]MCP1997162.1 hypothetical protein [Flavobacterium sp. HSC-61S13]
MKKNYLLTPFKVPIALVLLCFITFSTWAQSITTHPTTLTKNDGQAASFHVVVNGTVSAYQWQVSRDGGLTYKSITDDNTYSGSKTTTLNIGKASLAMNGNFYQLTTVVNGQSLTSRQAILNVFPSNSSAQWDLQGSAGFSEQPTASYANIVFAPNGTSYVAYMDGLMGKISVMKWNGSSWEKVGLSGFSAGMANHVKIAISPLGVPYVAFMDDVNLGKATVMKFDGSQWVNVGSAGFSAGKAYHLSLAFHQTEHPYLAFSDGSVGNKASVMKFDGTTWQIFGTSGFSNGGCTSLNLAFNGSGVPYVGYVDSKDFLNPNITVMTFINNSWTVVGSPAFYPERINDANLALDPTGTPYVAFRVGKYGNKANVMKFDGISWQSVGTPHFSENASTMLTFIIDRLGDPYVTFIDSGKNNTNQASVMKWNGNEWVLVGEASFSQAAVNYPRIALDLHSNPFVAYTDQAYGGKMTVMKFLAAAPTITQQPTDQNVLATQSTEFSVITTAITPTYQWQISTDEGKTFNPITDGSVYTGATTSILNLNHANASMNGYLYRVVINNGKDSYSDSAALTVQSGILIQQQPQDITACPGNNASLSVLATGVTNYQWQLDEGLGYYDLIDNSSYVGTNSATLTINGVTIAMNGYKYRVFLSASSAPTITQTALLSIPTLIVDSEITELSCSGGNTAKIALSTTGGTAPYSYLWNNKETSDSISNLTAATYSVVITDANGCINTKIFDIIKPSAITIVDSQSNVTCNGASNGTVTATASGGTAPYAYSWSPKGGTTQTATGLTAGTYTVTVTDSKGCVINHSYEITEPTALNANTSQQNVACFGSATASASATPTGGTAPYSFKWSNGATTQGVTGLSMGDHQLVITDAKGCSITKEFNILQYPKMEVVTSQTDVICYGSFTGSATVVVSGGASGYTYSWAPIGGSESTATGLQAGQYAVTITDAKGCTTTESFTIAQPEPLVITSTQTNISCSGNPYGTATIETTGGSAPYTYIWTTPNAVLNQAIDLTLGTYTVQVTDAKGCTATQDIVIISETVITLWNGTSWSNGSPNSLDTRAIFQADFIIDTNIKACSISVENNAKVVIKSGNTLTVNHEVAIEVGADLIIEDQANLLQIQDNTNSGMATVISRSSPMKWLDYTIWSSSVSSQNVFDFSPETVSSRIFTYKGNLQTVNQSPINSTLLSNQSVMEIGYGYFFRAPNTYHSQLPNSAVYEGKFRGVLNNGALVVNTYGSQFTSVGNPYPSALDLSDIVTNYSATVYFYTNSYEYINGAYAGNNYASYNSTGATSSGNGIVPTGVVQKGQGFIIETPTSAIEFNNSMRVNTGGAMMKPNIIERHRYWIDLVDTKTKLLYNQILVGYLQGATSGFDDGKDAKLLGHDGTTLYSLIDHDQTGYIIQGKGLPFVSTDKVTLGFKAVETGNFTIKINKSDGLFEQDQPIILIDKLLNIEHDLIQGDYLFTSESGLYNQRFEIVYNSQKLATEKPKDVDINDWLAYKKGDLLQIESIGFDIQYVEVYDMLGKRLFKSPKINAKNYVLPLINNQQILIIKLQTMENQTLYKKIKN